MVCPSCRGPLANGRCDACEITVHDRDGIPSICDDVRTDPVAESLSNALPHNSMRTVADRVAAATGRDEDALLARLVDTRPTDWRILLGGSLRSPCLDLHVGYGTRALALGEHLSDVIAADPDIARLRIIDRRSDFEGDVRPIHTSVDTLPFLPSSFATIVADFTQPGIDPDRETLRTLIEYLRPGGLFCGLVDGWSRQLGMIGSLRMHTDRRPRLPVFSYRQRFASAGLQQVRLCPLVPAQELLEFVFPLDSDIGMERTASLISDQRNAAGGTLDQAVATMVRHTRSFPSYLVVGTNGTAQTPICSNTLLTTGRLRSVVLSYRDGELQSVWKIPNRAHHSVYTEHENEVTAHLTAVNDPIVNTIPDGLAVQTPYGISRKEQPVSGMQLHEKIRSSPAAVGEVLETAFDWLERFQVAFRGEDTILTAAQQRELLRCDNPAVIPPSIATSTPSFSVPVHGDFTTENVFVRNDRVTSVIDWEYSEIAGLPHVDAAFLLLDTLRRVTGSPSKAARVIRDHRPPYGTVARTALRQYCENVGIEPDAVCRLLALPYVRRLRVDAAHAAMTHQSEKAIIRSELAQAINDGATR